VLREIWKTHPIALIAVIGAVLFTLVRLTVLTTSDSMYLEDPEELFVGNLPADIVSGVRLQPLRDYCLWVHWTQQPAVTATMMSFAVLPFYYCFGPFWLCLKIGSLLLSLLSFILLMIVMTQWIDRKAALIAGALALFPPANAIYYQLWANLGHPYIFIAILALFIAVHRMETARDCRGRNMWTLALGVIMGFFSWCWTSNVFTVALLFVLLMYAWCRDPNRRLGASLALLFAGIAVGCSPFLLHSHTVLGFFRAQSSHAAYPFRAVVRRSVQMAGPSLMHSYTLSGGGGALWAYGAYALGIASYLWVCSTPIKGYRITLTTFKQFLLLYPILYIACMAYSPAYFPGERGYTYGMSHLRYLSPLLGIIMVTETIAIRGLLVSRRRIPFYAGIAILVFLVAFGCRSLLSVMNPSLTSTRMRAPGYFRQEIGCRTAEASISNDNDLRRTLNDYTRRPDRVTRNDLARGAAWIICADFAYGATRDGKSEESWYPDYLARVSRCAPPSLVRLFKEELGACVYWNSPDLDAALKKLKKIPKADAELSYLGVARMLPARIKNPSAMGAALARIPAADRGSLAHAMGQYYATFSIPPTDPARVAGNLTDRDSFLSGCNDPYGTWLCWPPCGSLIPPNAIPPSR
jgi:hypothetical protein